MGLNWFQLERRLPAGRATGSGPIVSKGEFRGSVDQIAASFKIKIVRELGFPRRGDQGRYDAAMLLYRNQGTATRSNLRYPHAEGRWILPMDKISFCPSARQQKVGCSTRVFLYPMTETARATFCCQRSLQKVMS